MEKWINVKQMYDYANTNGIKLLSEFNAPFWTPYKTDFDKYDSLFKRLYKSFRYFDQDIFDKDLNVEDVTNEFIAQVYNHLLLNEKRYEELFRLEVLDDDEYNFLTNINYKETRNDAGSADRTLVSGTRTDNTTATEGQRSDTSEEQVSAFNESTYTNRNKTTDIKGAETDTSQFTKGAETDTDNLSTTSQSIVNRSGLMSKDSMSDLVRKHLRTWDGYKFYSKIFGEIAEELLLV